MSTKSGIEWTDATWNPIAGCTRVSEGCRNCYAERMAKRLQAAGVAGYRGTTDTHGRWTGRVNLIESALDLPRRWKKPRMIFVNSMSDLFHDQVPIEYIERVFRVMNECPQHTFQVLTKRDQRLYDNGHVFNWTPNIWMGVSMEHQNCAYRLNALFHVNAVVRFASIEPLIGPVNADPYLWYMEGGEKKKWNRLHWVIVGGESGPGARPMHPNWARAIRDQCVAAGVPFFFKQWGGVNKKAAGRLLDGREWNEMPNAIRGEGNN